MNDDCLLIRLKGKTLFNVEGILSAMADGSMTRYERLIDRPTLLNPKQGILSHLYHTLGDMMTYAKHVDGWYENSWMRTWSESDSSLQCMDTLFKDEFEFLVAEGLIIYKEFEQLSQEKIYANLNVALEKGDVGDAFKHSMLSLCKEIIIT